MGLACEILSQGCGNPELVDEIYIQLMKHLTHNKRQSSVNRARELICMSVVYLHPSVGFQRYCLNFFYQHVQEANLSGSCARYCLHKLATGMHRFCLEPLPRIEKLLSYRQRPPVVLGIKLVDGNMVLNNVKVLPDMSVNSMVDMCPALSA